MSIEQITYPDGSTGDNTIEAFNAWRAAEIDRWLSDPEWFPEDNEPTEDDIVIADAGNRGYAISEHNHGFICYAADWDEVVRIVHGKLQAEAAHGWFPATWMLSDHGNYHPTSIYS